MEEKIGTSHRIIFGDSEDMGEVKIDLTRIQR